MEKVKKVSYTTPKIVEHYKFKFENQQSSSGFPGIGYGNSPGNPHDGITGTFPGGGNTGGVFPGKGDGKGRGNNRP